MKTKLTILLLSLSLTGCYASKSPMPSKSYGYKTSDKGMVLVAYATGAGSTIQVADSIAYVIAEQGYMVNLMHIDNVNSLTGYNAVLIGSAIRMGNVTPEVKKFVEAQRMELQSIPTAFFISCLTLKDDTPENREAVKAYLAPLREIVEPFAEGYFAGKMDYSKLNRFDSFIAKRMVKAPEGDFRDWSAIKIWSEKIF